MDSGRTRIRVCLQAGELEVEGTEEFVAKYSTHFNELIDRMRTGPLPTAGGGSGSGPSDGGGASAARARDVGEFPEALHRMSSTSGTDQILVAGSFARLAHSDATFSTNEANALLLEQGIKLANASQSMANNLKAKRVFKSGKNWKISRTGEDYVRTLI